jgi:REP element-mobilizing transposase RayT
VAKKPRLAGKELFHHIYAWGNDRHPVFKADFHYMKYIEFLKKYALRNGIDIIAYALMETHVHLFIFDTFGNISGFMNSLHGSYAQFFNKVTGRIGHVFGERFNNKIVQANNYGLWLSRYIHRQAVEAGIVNDPKDYPWSSYLTYIGLAQEDFLKPRIILEQFGHGQIALSRYKEFVIGVDDGPIDWRKTKISIIGDKDFIENFEKLTDIDRTKDVKNQNNEDLLHIVSLQLQVSPSVLLYPRGWNERRLRHEAFKVLINQHGLSMRHVAQLFNISPASVVKTLSRADKKLKS